MKYRSPSPANVLPTPPHSPTTHDVAHSSITLLESLESFYLQERYWVHHTRAALELALAKGIDAPPSADTPSPSPSPSPPSSATTTSTDAAAVERPIIVKMEHDAVPPVMPRSASSRWLRRKNVMSLKIDGISPHQRKRRPLRAPPTEPSARLLEMFSELMDARMESCQRVQRMIRNANRADLFMR